MKKITKNIKNVYHKREILLFDGSYNNTWIEKLNSLISNERSFSFTDGSIFTLTPDVNIIFETTNLFYSTPSVISKCGLL